MAAPDMKALQAAGFGSAGEDPSKAAQREAMEEQRRMMLQSIMSAGARERLARVAMVKPEQARAVENHLLTQARSGKLKTQVDEDGLIRLLEEVAGAVASVTGGGAGPKVTIQRRKRPGDSDDDDDDF